MSPRWLRSLSLRARLKHYVSNFRIFLRTNRKEGVKNLNSCCRQISTGRSITFNFSSLDKRSFGCCSCFNNSFMHRFAVLRMLRSTRSIKSNSLKIMRKRCYKISQFSYRPRSLSRILMFFLHTLWTGGSISTVLRKLMIEAISLLHALIFRSVSSMFRLYSSSLNES